MKSILKPKIVVVGGGAGGLPLVTKLGKSLGKKNLACIELIDSRPTHIWKPLLHEIAAGTLDQHNDEINFLTHGNKNNYNFHLGEVTGIDKVNKYVHLAPLVDEVSGYVIHSNRKVKYDYLVLGIGSISNDFKIKGINEYCINLDTREKASYFHDIILKLLIKLSETKDEKLNITIMGGGATGVELAAELVYAINEQKKVLKIDSEIGKDITITIIEAGPSILNGLSNYIQEGVALNLEKLKVKILTNKVVQEIRKDEIITKDGDCIKAGLKVWACGIHGQNIVSEFNLPTNKILQIKTNRKLQVLNDSSNNSAINDTSNVYDDIYAFGDCALVPLDDKNQKYAPARASNSLQQADYLTNHFKALMNQDTKNLEKTYIYKDYGSLISVSKFNAFGKINGNRVALKIDGFNARIAYWSLYQKHLMAVYGWFNFWYFTIGSLYSSRVKPRVKLH